MNGPVDQSVSQPPLQRSRWSTLVLTLVVVGLYFLVTRPVPPPEGWGTDYVAAVHEAETTNRKVLVAFHMPGCPPCKVMDRTVLNQDAIKRGLGDYVPVRVDAARHPDLAGRYGAYATPTYAVIDSRGRLLARVEGQQTVEQFLTFLERAANSPPPAPDPSKPPPAGR